MLASRLPSTAIHLLIRACTTSFRIPWFPHLLVFLLAFTAVRLSILSVTWGTWGPAFPQTWSAWVALLVALPIFACMQIVWLLARKLRPNGDSDRETGEVGYHTLPAEEGKIEDGEAEDIDVRGNSKNCPLPRPSALLQAAHYSMCAIIIIAAIWNWRYPENPDDIRFRPALQRALSQSYPDRGGYARGEKIFIAAAFYNNEAVLPYWTRTMLDTITYLGPDNVFVSIVESYSEDQTPTLLRAFAAELDRRDVPHRIFVQDGAVARPPVLEGNPRVEYLAAVRNRALEPLVERGGYDRVLFSNDIYVEPESIIELLETRGGEYDFACALDFDHFGAYDAWVLRDRVGKLAGAFWPYFLDATDRAAMEADEPVPVLTCWNGIVAFAADPLLPMHLRRNHTLSHKALGVAPPARHPLASVAEKASSPALTPPLRFRASAEGECFSSESFLLPYDFRRIMGLDRIFVNPRVITAYKWKFYVWNKWVLRQRYVQWFVERVWKGRGLEDARMVVGDAQRVWTWDGIDCHPWWKPTE